MTSVLVSFDGCDDACVLDSVSPRFTVFVGTSTGSLELRLFLIDRATRSCREGGGNIRGGGGAFWVMEVF